MRGAKVVRESQMHRYQSLDYIRVDGAKIISTKFEHIFAAFL